MENSRPVVGKLQAKYLLEHRWILFTFITPVIKSYSSCLVQSKHSTNTWFRKGNIAWYSLQH